MMLHLQKISFAPAVAAARGAAAITSRISASYRLGYKRLYTPFTLFFSWPRAKIEQNIFTLWSTS